jgi:hypothetical protein
LEERLFHQLIPLVINKNKGLLSSLKKFHFIEIETKGKVNENKQILIKLDASLNKLTKNSNKLLEITHQDKSEFYFDS